jgi:uncharacterized protein (PEP-CTERM system associated)
MGRDWSRNRRKRSALHASGVRTVLAATLACGAMAVTEVVEAQSRPPSPDATATPTAIARTSLRPYLMVQESFTDNAALTEGGGRSDFITRALVGLAAQIDRGHLTAVGRIEYAYDWYAKTSGQNGGMAYGNGSASYSLLRERLSIDADGTISQAYTSSSPTLAVDRAGTPGRTRLEIYRIGPRLEAPLGSFADIVAAVRSQWVSYTAEDNASAQQLPPDTNIFQAVGRIDTGSRFAGYQLLTSGSLVRDDHDYRAASAVQTAYLRVAPRTRLIGRAGYEQIRESDIVDVDAPVLSVGVEVRPNATSRVSIEGGRRYDRNAWNARADVKIGKAVTATGEYYETLSPSQVYVANSFERFVDQTRDLPAPVAPQTFATHENIYDQTSYNKVAEFHVIYSSPRQALDLSARWSRREFVDTKTKDVNLFASALYTRRIRPDLEMGVDINYSRTFDSPVYGEFESYDVSARALYRLNSTTDLNASYHYTHGAQLSASGTTRENLFRISIEKRF